MLLAGASCVSQDVEKRPGAFAPPSEDVAPIHHYQKKPVATVGCLLYKFVLIYGSTAFICLLRSIYMQTLSKIEFFVKWRTDTFCALLAGCVLKA